MIITENEKNFVVFSSLFGRSFPNLKSEIWNIIRSYHKSLGVVAHTRDYWARDYMPIQVEESVFIKFAYNPDYLQDHKGYITDVDKVISKCSFAKDYKIIDIPLIADGGNLVFCKGNDKGTETQYVVMTDKAFYENPQLSREQIELTLKCAFQETNLTIVWLPWDKEDIFGHTDGIVKYVGINESGKPKVLVNLELYDDDIATKMYSILDKHFEVIELKLSHYNDLSWAYINSLQTCDYIIIPGLGNAITDAEALTQYKLLFPQYGENSHQVQMREFIEEYGGALNCLTWTLFKKS